MQMYLNFPLLTFNPTDAVYYVELSFAVSDVEKKVLLISSEATQLILLFLSVSSERGNKGFPLRENYPITLAGKERNPFSDWGC